VQLSDPHVSFGPADCDSAGALQRVVEIVLEMELAPDAVLLTGDLTQHGQAAEYMRVRELVGPIGAPVHPIPGNHDDPVALRSAFADHPQLSESEGRINYQVTAGELRLLMLDSVIPGRPDGAIGLEALDWLSSRLAEDKDTPTLVALHHPPIATGIKAMDEIDLAAAERKALAFEISRAPGVRSVVAGHVHRPIVGALAGCPVFVSPSTLGVLTLTFRDGVELSSSTEPPGFAIHRYSSGSIVSHCRFTDRQPVEPAALGLHLTS
jgi:3',5'-cyclic AMP phosphodiesterase CpdA